MFADCKGEGKNRHGEERHEKRGTKARRHVGTEARRHEGNTGGLRRSGTGRWGKKSGIAYDVVEWRNMFSRLILIFTTLLAGPAMAQITTTRPFPGVTYSEEIRTNPPLRLFWAQADLSNSSVHLRVCPGGAAQAPPWETTLLPVSKIAEREHLDIAVNGSAFAPKDVMNILGRRIPYFEGNLARSCGWTMTDGRLWSASPLGNLGAPTLIAHADGSMTISTLTTVPTDAKQMVSGFAPLLKEGRNQAPDDSPAPRCAVGLDREARTLTLMVIDGRQLDYSAGVSLEGLAHEMALLDCWTAVAMDGGGSATMVRRDGQKWNVVNRPSDGHDFPIRFSIERAVASAIGISVDGAR